MTISPQQQLSKVRGRKRYSAWVKLNAKRLQGVVSLQYDKDGQAVALSHFASPITGEYKGRKVLRIRSTGSKNQVKKVRA